MQIQKAIIWARQELMNIEEGSSDALFLLEHATGKNRGYMIAFPEEALTDMEWINYQSFIKQRQNHIPVSQIIGQQPFWKWEFKVSDDVLTPRADSEVLIEAMLDEFEDKGKPYKIADFGTGSGCLLLSALSEYSKGFGYGVDINSASLNIARKNEAYIKQQGAIINKVNWVSGGWDALTQYAPFDIILANPPYIAYDEKEDLMPEVLNHDPYIALFAPDDGLQAYKLLFPLFKKILAPDGIVYIEHGYKQQDAVIELAQISGLIVKRSLFDLSKNPRGLVLTI